MMQTKLLLALAASALCSVTTAQTQAPAFPGAEGHGRYTTGGRGGKVVHVTNLNDSGTGSLREAVKGDQKKTIVFDVGGVIALAGDLSIGKNTTILGQTAPYPGITLRYRTVRPGSNNIIRFIRVRRGQEKDVNDGADAIWNSNLTGLIIDHCSFSWSIDEVASFYDNNNFTMQWCTLGESLNNAGHDKGAHGYGGIWGGKLASFHHNMIAHVNNRAPRFNGARYNWNGYTANTLYAQYNWENTLQAENVDFRNCLVFDWGDGGCYGGPGGGYINMVNNYFKPTPETKNKTRLTQVSVANSTTSDNPTFMNMTSRYYISGNTVNGTANYDWSGVAYDSGIPTIGGERYTLDSLYYYGEDIEHVRNAAGIPCVRIKLDSPIAPSGDVTTHSAEQAYAKIMGYGGASLYRDDVDARYMSEAQSGTSTYTGSVTKVKGRIDLVADVDGYTEANFPTGKRAADFDTDGDGMPDAWETANGLNPNDATDGAAYTLDAKGYYTNLEVYANALVEDIVKAGNAGAETSVNEYFPTAKKAEGIDYYTGRLVERVAQEQPQPSADLLNAANQSFTWDFRTMAAGAVNIQKATGTVPSGTDGVELFVDATNGKLWSRGSDAQFNAGTIIRVPVKAAKDSVIVTSYPGYHHYTVGGAAAAADETVHLATAAEAAQGYVEVVGTGSSYLYAIRTVFVSKIQEKALYHTTFTEWTDAKAATTPSNYVAATTYSNETLTFGIFNTQVSSTNQNTAKFPTWQGGYLMASKAADPYVTTSTLACITRVHFIHGATGSNRGWKLEAKGDGDTDWVVLSNSVATTAAGTEVEVEVNRTNCQLRFTNLNPSQNAYLFQLDIYGNVDMGNSPTLGSFTANGTAYSAIDLFDQDADGNYTATVEVSKTADMVGAANAITATADNGTLGEITYEDIPSTANGSKPEARVTIPVSLGTTVARYIINFVWKPNYTVSYYSADGAKLLSRQTVEKDATIGTLADGSNVAVPAGSKFRGWLFKVGTTEKALPTTVVATDGLKLYALVTDIEGDEPNERNVFDLKDKYFDADDHEAFSPTSAYAYNGPQHGLNVKAGSVKLLVGGNATIIVEACQYSKAAMTLTDARGNIVGTVAVPVTDGAKTALKYAGPAGELTLSFDQEVYLHRLTIINTGTSDIVRNAEGYYVAEAGSGSSLLNILDVIEANEDGSSRVKVFLPNGTYDLGQTVELTLPVDNISIVGQSMDSTIIVTTPDAATEGLGKADLFYNTRQNIYFQDLTLKNALDYYGAGAAGRAAVMQDRGNRTIYKNVRMLSYQDTYYSQNSAMQSYFEGCDIHGTVDFICGGGDVRFQNTTISLEPRNANGTGGRTITAPTTTTAFGYVFDGCTIVDLAQGKGDWNYGRTWQNDPICVFLNTKFDEHAQTTIIASRWTEKGMNNKDPKVFGEYATQSLSGDDITPASNVIASHGGNFETILTAAEAEAYSYEKMFAGWGPRELSAQVATGKAAMTDGMLTWSPAEGATAYAVFRDNVLQAITTANSYATTDASGTWTVRAANAMGGFGQPTAIATGIQRADIGTAISTTYYSPAGMKLSQPQPGVNIRVCRMANGQTVTEKVMVK